MPPTFLNNRSLRLIFFGGKGGVGKTTSASAAALWLAANHPAKKFLLVSTDPAHSLSDSFERKIGDEVVSFSKNLSLREYDAAQALEKFKGKYEHEIKLITDRGTYFDNADIDSFFRLSLPGVDEVMGILEIAELIEKREYETIIVDTAPTGHTLSMLCLPELLDKWLGVFDLMEGKHHLIEEHFTRRTTEDESDVFLKMMHGRLQRIAKLLCDPAETEFVVVTIPEEVVFAETERLVNALFELRIPVHSIIVNRVSMNKGCPYCEKRESSQRALIDKLEAKALYRKIFIPIFPAEVRGLGQLKLFASFVAGEESSSPHASSSRGEEKRGGGRKLVSAQLSIKNLGHAKFLMLCGKGGVGKTTTAAATALLLARQQPELKHQLYSIDPAHSLSDCFSKTIGDKGVKIVPNLCVCELNAEKLYRQFQSEYQDAIDDLFNQFSGGVSHSRGIDFRYDRELLKELLATSPPGLEELMALQRVMAELEAGTDCVILDTAPTGHFVRFLELPGLVRSWLGAIFELLLKYRGVVQLGAVAEKLVSLSRKIRSVMDVMTDNKRACAVVVTIPEAMSIAETGRLIRAIDDHNIRCAGVVVNMITDVSTDCSFCASRAANETQWIKEIRRFCDNAALVPYVTWDVRGVDRLNEFGKLIWQ